MLRHLAHPSGTYRLDRDPAAPLELCPYVECSASPTLAFQVVAGPIGAGGKIVEYNDRIQRQDRATPLQIGRQRVAQRVHFLAPSKVFGQLDAKMYCGKRPSA